MPDNLRQDAATSGDNARPPTTSGDNEFTLSIADVVALYEQAGHPRTPRSIQRYCAKGHLEYRVLETPFGEKFLISPASVSRHIAYINEVRLDATGRDVARQVAPFVAATNNDEIDDRVPPANNDNVRQAETENNVSQSVAPDQRVIDLLERENEFLREQVKMKDKQIAEQSERSRETNVLINGLQKMLSPLLGSPDLNRAPRQPDDRHREPDEL